MFRESIRFPSIFFVVSIIWQFIFDREVKWVDNIGICLLMFLFILFYNWSKVPYKWEKEHHDQ